MSRRRCRRCRQSGFTSMVDDSAHIASRCGPAGALATGFIGFIVLYAVLPMCVSDWIGDNKAKLVGPAASALGHALEQVASLRLIEPSQWAGTATLLVCTAIALWKYLERPDLGDEGVDSMCAAAKFVSSLLGRGI